MKNLKKLSILIALFAISAIGTSCTEQCTCKTTQNVMGMNAVSVETFETERGKKCSDYNVTSSGSMTVDGMGESQMNVTITCE